MPLPSKPPPRKRVWDDPRIVVPPDDVWMAWSPEERDDAFERIRAVFEEYREADCCEQAADSAEPAGAAGIADRRALGDGPIFDPLARLQVSLARVALDTCRLRGLALTPRQHARVVAEHDLDVLSRWAERALTAETGDALFDDVP